LNLYIPKKYRTKHLKEAGFTNDLLMKHNFFYTLALAPIAFVYDIITETRNKLFDWQIIPSTEFKFPVISVGNITVGGTGKTPHIEYLIRLLSEKNYKIAVLSRGYKRKSKGFQDSETKAGIENLGDELYQMYKKFPMVGFFAHGKRVQGVKKIISKNKYDVILLDDAFQHRKITPGLSILINDYNRPFYEDHLLPLGRLREHPHQKKRAQLIITSKCPPNLKPIEQRIVFNKLKMYPYQDLYFSTMLYANVKPVFGQNTEAQNWDAFLSKYEKIILFTGIAQAQHLKNEIEQHGKLAGHFEYPDHYSFQKKDIEEIEKKYSSETGQKIILTSEKDASRLKELNEDIFKEKNHYFYIEIEVELLNKTKEFHEQILQYVANNRRKH